MENEVKKEENLPLVSVVMITFNHEDHIEESLMSVITQQSRDYNLEILIVDDGSSDNTQKIITSVQRKYPDIVFPTFKMHVGVTAINKNLNEQIRKARGEYIVFLAGDDYFVGDGLSKQLKAFGIDKNIKVVIGEGRNFDIAKNEFLGTCQEDAIVKMLKNREMFNVYEYIVSNVPRLFIQGFMVKKSLLESVDYFDEELIADDWILNIRIFKYLVENNKLAVYLDYEVFKRNMLQNSTSNNHEVHFKRIFEVIHKYVPYDKKNNILKNLYLRYFLTYLGDRNYTRAFLFFIKYFSKDIFLMLFAKTIIKKIIK